MHYPLFIEFKNKKVLIIGCGNVGSRRALSLLNSGAKITIISKKFKNYRALAGNKHVKLIKNAVNERNVNKIKLDNFFLAIISTNDKVINELISNKIKEFNRNPTTQNRVLLNKQNYVLLFTPSQRLGDCSLANARSVRMSKCSRISSRLVLRDNLSENANIPQRSMHHQLKTDGIFALNKKDKNNMGRILVCRADNYRKGDVIFPSVSNTEKGTIAFTTHGKNPRLSKKVRELLRNA